MKRAFIVVAISIMVLLSFAPNVFRVSAASGLADTINSLANGINWSNRNMILQHTGYVFHYVSTPNYGLSYPNAGPPNQLGISTLNYLEGTGSPTDWSSRVPSYDQLADTYQGNVFVYYRWADNLYNWFPSSWNKATALAQFTTLVNSVPELTYPGRLGNPPGSQRYYDEWMETADIYLALGSIAQAISTFQHDYDTHWNGAYWGYTGMSGTECEAAFFAMLASKLYVANGNSLPHFDTVVADMVYKFLANGWNSPQWGSPTTYVCTHYADTRERLQNDVGSWAALHMLWTYFTPTQQAQMINMLTGNGGTSAWQHLMQSLLYQPAINKFIEMNGDSTESGTPDDAWTSIALEDLFFRGIVPGTGSLAIPLNEQTYEDFYTWFLATNFGFNYAGHQIKIPVRTGTLNFLFGTTESSWTFTSDGIYTVQFANDWNSVLNVNRQGGLSSNLAYLPVAGSPPPPTTGTLNLSATYNGNPVAATVTITGPTNTVVTTQASPTVTAGTYTLVAHYDSLVDLTRTSVIVPPGGTATVTFPFVSGAVGTLQIDAKYAGVRVAVQVTVTGTGFSQTDTTTTGSLPPLSYSVNVGTYQVSGSYQDTPLNQSFTVQAGSPTDAVLDFGGGNDWWQWLMHNPIVIVVLVASVGIVSGGTAIGLKKAASQPPPSRHKGRRRKH